MVRAIRAIWPTEGRSNRAWRSRSAARIGTSMVRWVCMAPLGAPVVPEV